MKHILEYLERTTAQKPDKTAVIDGERSISFQELTHEAKLLASYILQKDTAVFNQPIGVFLEKSIESIVADIGVLYSANAYMNLDVKAPAQRLGGILEKIRPAYVITDEKHLPILEGIWDSSRVLLIDGRREIASISPQIEERLARCVDTDPMCLISTSGSTGIPKGAILNHRSFLDVTNWACRHTPLEENCIFGTLVPIVFDVFTFELCLMMSQGCSLLIIPAGLAAFPVRILELLNRHQVTHIFWVPTIMVNIANMGLLSSVPLPYLKAVWWIGEVFPTAQFNLWRKALPHAQFANFYGPIEITVFCTYYIVDREIPDNEPVPIGWPCENSDVFLLNEQGQLVAPGEEGEICVRGSSLAMGYYNDPERTAAAFTQNPLNPSYPELIYHTGDLGYWNERGELMFKGRRDNMIKHSGYRIELGDIEHAILNTLKLVENGCAVYDQHRRHIVFFYQAPEEVPVLEFRRKISSVLPKYMIPDVYIRLETMPRNTNGKIDRFKLKEQANQP